MIAWFRSGMNHEEKKQALGEYMSPHLDPVSRPSRLALEMLGQIARKYNIDISGGARRRITFSRRMLRIAAVVLPVMIVATALLYFGRLGENNTLQGSATKTILAQSPALVIEAPGDARREAILADGTLVRLNPGSRITVPARFEAGERRVSLEGEAYFDVTHDEARPLYVETGKLLVRVLGTKFNVAEAHNNTIVTLIAGAVEVQAGTYAETLAPHHKLTFNHLTEATEIVILTPEELAEAHRYEPRIIIEKRTIPDILRIIGLYYNVTVQFDPATLPNGNYSISLPRDEPVENVLSVLSMIGGNFRFRREGDTITIHVND